LDIKKFELNVCLFLLKIPVFTFPAKLFPPCSYFAIAGLFFEKKISVPAGLYSVKVSCPVG
jgi:hypothetical protein